METKTRGREPKWVTTRLGSEEGHVREGETEKKSPQLRVK